MVSDTIHSKGVIISISHKFDGKIIKVIKSDIKRFICVKIEVNMVKYNLWNFYGPNIEKEKFTFVRYIQTVINEHGIDGHNILGGDFNINLDKTGNSKIKDALNSCIGQNNLQDAWRQKHGNKKRFTWQRLNPKCVSTLDYWFVPTLLNESVIDCQIITAPGTDHLAVTLKLCTTHVNKRNGTWKFNNSLLMDEKFNSALIEMIEKCCHDYDKVLSKRGIWDLCKNEIRSFTIKYCSVKRKIKSTLKDLETKMNDVKQELCYDDSSDLHEKYMKTKLDLEIAWQHITDGAKVRSKEKWIQEGEKNTKYFLNLEKRNVVNKTITSLYKSDGTVVTDQEGLLQEQVLYYESLYKNKNTADPNAYECFKKGVNVKKLNDEEKKCCEGKLTKSECLETLKEMQNNKSPGYDGLTVEFYKCFWPHIESLVVNSLNEGFDYGKMASSQRQGIITLLHKGKDLSRQDLSNWRPITLINVDYKIATKALAKRLQNVISSVIDSDQTGYIKGRYIGENVRLIEDVLRYTEIKNIPGLLLLLDFSKVFDNIDTFFSLC